MQRIKIVEYTPRRTLAFDLKDLLSALKPWGSNLAWSVFFLHGAGEDIVRLEAISKSRHGISLDWRELLELGERVTQTYDGIFVGCTPGETIPMHTGYGEIETPDSCELVLEAVDSTYWVVGATDPGALKAIEGRFRHTEPYVDDDRIPSPR